MSGFSREWLAMREEEDARARDGTLPPGLAHPRGDVLRVVDLGAGAGANLRYLAPRLSLPQHWTLIDGDNELLSAVVRPQCAFPLEIEVRQMDLARGLDGLPCEGCDLVTASAFFDLVSRDWLERLAARCAAARVPGGLFALSVNGRIAWAPGEPEDGEIAALFHADMKRDKGFGPALGPAAPRALSEAFAAAGYAVRSGDSSWRLGPTQADIQNYLLEGYAGVAAAAAPGRAAAITGWAKRRAAHIARGTSRLTVGHDDVLVKAAQ